MIQKNTAGKRIISYLLTAVMLISLIPASALMVQAAAQEIDLASPLPSDSEYWQYNDGVYTILNGADVLVTGINTDGRRIAVAAGATVNMTMEDASITGLDSGQTPLWLNAGSNVTLTLLEENTLEAGEECAGIYIERTLSGSIENSATLTITDASTGRLTVTGGDGGSGIGSSEGTLGGVLIINGGTVNATGGNRFSGIGGGSNDTSSLVSIRINGGTVISAGGDGGYGIGSGATGGGTPVYINGGIVRAIGNGGVGVGFKCQISMNGNGILSATNIDDETIGSSEFENGILFLENERSGTVYGSVMPEADLEVPAGHGLNIPDNASLTIAENLKLANHGTVTNNGRMNIRGTVVNSGSFMNNGTITFDGGSWEGDKIIPLNSGGTDSVLYTGNAIPLASMFRIDQNAGAPAYQIKGGSGEGVISGADLSVTKAGTFEIGLTTAETDLYQAGEEVLLNLTVDPAPLAVHIAMKDKIYDGTDNAQIDTATLSGILGGDDVALAQPYPAAYFEDSGLGHGKAVRFVDDFTLTGAKAGCYVLTQPTAVTADIIGAFTPQEGVHYNVVTPLNTAGWTRGDADGNFVVSAGNGYQIARPDEAVPDWQDSLAWSAATEDGIAEFYVRNINTSEISMATAAYKMDGTPPAGEVQYKQNGYSVFLNKASFGLFFKKNLNIAIRGTDDLSGVAAIEYYKAGAAVADPQNITGWIGGDSLSVTQNEKFVLYIRITDHAGNTTIYHDGIVVYTDSTAAVNGGNFLRNSSSDLPVTVAMNNNTVKTVTNGNKTLAAGADYTAAGNTITLKRTYLASLPNGPQTFTVTYNPLGETGTLQPGSEAPGTTRISVNIVDNTPKVNGVTVSPKTVKVQKGKKKQFSVSVTGENNPSRTVTWKVSGNKKSGTKISASGILTIAADETAAKLTVTATSTIDKTKSGTAAVTVVSPKTPKPDHKAVPKNKTVKRGSKITLKAPKSTMLYFTTNGKKPTTKSKKVKAGKKVKITVKKKTKVKVIAVRTGYKASAVVTRTYKVR